MIEISKFQFIKLNNIKQQGQRKKILHRKVKFGK